MMVGVLVTVDIEDVDRLVIFVEVGLRPSVDVVVLVGIVDPDEVVGFVNAEAGAVTLAEVLVMVDMDDAPDDREGVIVDLTSAGAGRHKHALVKREGSEQLLA